MPADALHSESESGATPPNLANRVHNPGAHIIISWPPGHALLICEENVLALLEGEHWAETKLCSILVHSEVSRSKQETSHVFCEVSRRLGSCSVSSVSVKRPQCVGMQGHRTVVHRTLFSGSTPKRNNMKKRSLFAWLSFYVLSSDLRNDTKCLRGGLKTSWHAVDSTPVATHNNNLVARKHPSESESHLQSAHIGDPLHLQQYPPFFPPRQLADGT